MVVKITKNMRFSPSFDYIDDGIEHGIFSKFETKQVLLKKGLLLIKVLNHSSVI